MLSTEEIGGIPLLDPHHLTRCEGGQPGTQPHADSAPSHGLTATHRHQHRGARGRQTSGKPVCPRRMGLTEVISPKATGSK